MKNLTILTGVIVKNRSAHLHWNGTALPRDQYKPRCLPSLTGGEGKPLRPWQPAVAHTTTPGKKKMFWSIVASIV